jgi:ABC-type multidrug transport system ATPase subunit
MPHLTGTDNQKITLGTGSTVIGRDAAQCQVVLDQLFISRLQAVIEVNQQGQAALRNLSSKRTTFVNGRPVDTCVLQSGDRVEFGAGQLLTFIFHGAPPAQQQPSASAFSFEPLPSGPGAGKETYYQQPHQQPYQPEQSATSVFRVAPSSRLRIGRASDNEIVLDAPSVSRHHAELAYDGDPQPVITDLGSTNGTFVNGEILRSTYRLAASDWVTIGGYLLSVNGREVKKQDLSASRIVAYNVGKQYGNRTVLQDVSFALYPREFVGLMGASGCGKSTLMDALNGMRPAGSGSVFINDMDLYQNFDLLRRSIGYVPQRDILHEALTVERTLYYAARMRLPSSTSSTQRDAVVSEVIDTVGLEEQRHNAFGQLSGGQQKRLSLGIELITKPNFLFLDEPTSPLDPESTENMMLLFRRLADEGRIVVMVTHKFEKFNSMHHIALLTKGGRLAYFGPPGEAMQYFNCQEPGEIYRRLGERTPEELSRSFSGSHPFQKYVASRFNEMQELANRSGGISTGAEIPQTGAERKFGFGQWWTLTQRYLEIKLKDKRNTILMLAQAPLVALVLALITNNTANDGRTIFIAAIIAIWLGANNAIREIVSEIDVYTRERLVNLKIPSYVLSKFAILSGIGLIQCFLFVIIQTAFGRFETADFPMLTLILYLSLLAGVSIGLFFSALVNSTEKAMSILPLILIPQLLLSGFLKPLDDLYVNVNEGKPAVAADYDKFKREEKNGIKIDPNNPTAPPKIPVTITKQEGLGAAQIAAATMPARWTIDALAHQVSIGDLKARDKLAAQMTVKEYQNVLDNRSDTAIVDAYESRVRIDLLILAVFSLLFLGLTMFAMKRKDRL